MLDGCRSGFFPTHVQDAYFLRFEFLFYVFFAMFYVHESEKIYHLRPAQRPGKLGTSRLVRLYSSTSHRSIATIHYNRFGSRHAYVTLSHK